MKPTSFTSSDKTQIFRAQVPNMYLPNNNLMLRWGIQKRDKRHYNPPICTQHWCLINDPIVTGFGASYRHQSESKFITFTHFCCYQNYEFKSDLKTVSKDSRKCVMVSGSLMPFFFNFRTSNLWFWDEKDENLCRVPLRLWISIMSRDISIPGLFRSCLVLFNI